MYIFYISAIYTNDVTIFYDTLFYINQTQPVIFLKTSVMVYSNFAISRLQV